MKYDIAGQETCEACGHPHGPLYICPSYPADKKAAIQAKADEFRANLTNPAWVAEQKASGIPQAVIDIYKIFAGVKDRP